MDPDPDDLAELLAAQPGSPPPGLREELLRRTEHRLTLARWGRRGVRAAAVAAVFLVGGMAGWFARPERERVIEVAGNDRAVPVFVPVPVPVSGGVAQPSPTTPPLSASEVELRAEQTDDRTEAARLYRVAGDSFLRREDYTNATRCYRLYLNRAGDGGLSPEPADSWRLTSLKNAAYKEKTDAPKTDS